jgi:myo-inositol-1(or 4)-monophosphatase
MEPDLDLQGVHDFLVKLALEAGQAITSANPNFQDSNNKMNCKLEISSSMLNISDGHLCFKAADIVTETDKVVEIMVGNQLKEKYPHFLFIGEETYHPGQQLTDAPTFIVDPIDGTTNFVHGYPIVCISLGLVVRKIPTVGVVYNPFHGQLYTGIKGLGSYVSTNGGLKTRLPLRTRPEPLKDLSRCIVGVEWGNDRHGINYELKLKVYAKLTAAKEDGGRMVHSLRSIGSSALQVCYVATGQQDVFWEGGCWVLPNTPNPIWFLLTVEQAWDVAAGACILAEAGGLLVGGNPGDWKISIDSRKYLVVRGAPSGQEEIVQEFWDVMVGEKMNYTS